MLEYSKQKADLYECSALTENAKISMGYENLNNRLASVLSLNF